MRFLFFLLIFLINFSFSQIPDTLIKIKLPFYIHESKKMPAFELEDKKEGTFLTGVPRVEVDPIRGIGYGGNINLSQNCH